VSIQKLAKEILSLNGKSKEIKSLKRSAEVELEKIAEKNRKAYMEDPLAKEKRKRNNSRISFRKARKEKNIVLAKKHLFILKKLRQEKGI
jgi:hypothetical protein